MIAKQKDLSAYIGRLTTFDASTCVPLWVKGQALGQINQEWQLRLASMPELFLVTDHGIELRYEGNYQTMTERLAQAAKKWLEQGWITYWRHETFSAHNAEGDALFEIERAAFRPLGLISHAVHLNGWTKSAAGEVRMWVARRSLHKAADPFRMDNIMGGGVVSGESIEQALLREGWEEAGLSAQMMQRAEDQGLLFAERNVSRGIHREWLHIYDLWLREDEAPCNQDGEVAEHICLSLPEVETLLLQERFIADAALVTIDALVRMGYLKHKVLAKQLGRTLCDQMV